MKTIEIDDDLYAFIAAQTKYIGESASDILRRLLLPETPATETVVANTDAEKTISTVSEAPVAALAHETQTDILDSVSADKLKQFVKRVDQFLFILSVLHTKHAESFAAVEQIKGKNRTYFATSKAALLQNGSSTNPKPIPESQYWVVTNNNTAKKMAMIEQVMQKLGYDDSVIRTVVERFESGS